MFEEFASPFFQRALLAGILASLASGIMGSYVVVKKLSSLSGSIAHSIFGGIGFFLYLKYLLGWSFIDPMWGAFLMALFSAFLIGFVHLKYKQKEDAAIAAIWSSGMALGVIFVSLIPGYVKDFSSFFFGNILWISNADIYMLLILDALVFLLVFFFYPRFLIICFDEEQAKLQKMATKSLYFLLLSLISISIVLLMQVIGIILAIALLTIPPTLARLFTSSLFHMMLLSCLFCVTFNFFGTLVAYMLNFPPGPTIALISALVYCLSLLFSSSRSKIS